MFHLGSGNYLELILNLFVLLNFCLLISLVLILISEFSLLWMDVNCFDVFLFTYFSFTGT